MGIMGADQAMNGRAIGLYSIIRCPRNAVRLVKKSYSQQHTTGIKEEEVNTRTQRHKGRISWEEGRSGEKEERIIL
jgi:hypothetical protein